MNARSLKALYPESAQILSINSQNWASVMKNTFDKIADMQYL